MSLVVYIILSISFANQTIKYNRYNCQIIVNIAPKLHVCGFRKSVLLELKIHDGDVSRQIEMPAGGYSGQIMERGVNEKHREGSHMGKGVVRFST